MKRGFNKKSLWAAECVLLAVVVYLLWEQPQEPSAAGTTSGLEAVAEYQAAAMESAEEVDRTGLLTTWSGRYSALDEALCQGSIPGAVARNRRRGSILDGFVLDLNKQAVAGATITAFSQEGVRQPEVQSDADGHFRLENLHGTGLSSFVVSHPDFVQSRLLERNLASSQDWDRVHIQLAPQGTELSGVVVDTLGRPLAEQVIEAFWEHPKDAPIEFWSCSVTTTAEGRFAFQAVPAGDLWLARHSSVESRQEIRRVEIVPGEAQAVELEMAGSLRLQGDFAIAEHQGSAREILLHRSPEQPHLATELVAASVLDESRSFAFDHLRAGHYLLQIHLSAEIFARREIDLTKSSQDLGSLALERSDFLASHLADLERRFK
jgi:hypothetical protein